MKARCLACGRDMRRVVIDVTPVQRHVIKERYECPDCGTAAPIWWEPADVVMEWLQRQRPSHSAWKRARELETRPDALLAHQRAVRQMAARRAS